MALSLSLFQLHYLIRLNVRAVLVSYGVLLLSLAAIVIPRLQAGSIYNSYYFDFYSYGISYELLTTLAIAGLVVAPYFGLAGLIVPGKSVWLEANRMIHNHISIPFIIGASLLYGTTAGGSFFTVVIMAYIISIVVATLIGVMAARTTPASYHVPEPPAMETA